MRIAIFSWESLYTIQVGGLAVSASLLAEELAKRGHQVHFFTRGASGQPQYMRINGVDYQTLPLEPVPSSYSLALDMSRTMVDRLHSVEEHLGRFDIIHGHDWLVVDALQTLKGEGRSIIMTYHSTEYGRNGGRFGDWWGFREISDRERYAGQIADKVTTVSNSMKSELNWLYGIPLDKIEVIPNAIDPARYLLNLDAGWVKEQLGIHPLAPMIVFLGRLEYQKGPDLLVEAIPHVLKTRPDAKFIFIGQGGMRGYLESLSSRLGVSGYTRFLGFLPYLELLEKLNACDIVCIPSRNEPFGMVLLEAWAAGRPIVASDVGGLGENVNHMVDGIKVKPSAESIASGIVDLLKRPDLMARISLEGRRKVEEFGWDKSINKFLGVYSATLK